jgi:hypothetical protein
MANEIQFSHEAGKTCYALIRNQTSGYIWSTSGGTGGFEAYTTGNYADYKINVTEQGTQSAFYAGNIPSAMPAGVLAIVGKEQIGGSAAETDPTVAVGTENWNGSIIVPLSNLATSGQVGQALPLRLARGTMIQNFPIYFKSSADHVTPLTSGVVSGQISRDGGSFGALQSGAFTEIGLGWYNLQALTSGDTAANTIRLHFTAVGISGGSADPVPLSFILQRVSGQI